MNVRRKILILTLLPIFGLFFVFASTQADVLNQKNVFKVDKNFDKSGRDNISATLKYIGDKTYVYIEDAYWSRLDYAKQDVLMKAVATLVVEFETNIYPKETALYGKEPSPGVDNDPRITLLLEELINNNGGYFDTANGYSKSLVSDSNEREMIVVSVDSLMSSMEFAKIFLAHEFQHLISFNQKELAHKVSEDVWLNELRAEYTNPLVGYSNPYQNSALQRRIKIFVEKPSDSLVEWPNEETDYAIVNAFGQYLVEQFGQNILGETMQSELTGISSINQYLTRINYPGRFEDLFGYWMGAVYLNNSFFNKKFGYSNPDLMSIKVESQQKIWVSSALPNYTVSKEVKPWQPVWLEYDFNSVSADQLKSLKISFDGQTGNIFHAFYLVIYNDNTAAFGKILSGSRGDAYAVNSSKKVSKIAVMLTNGTKTEGFTNKEYAPRINVNTSIVDTALVKSTALKDGALIKRPRENEIYVVWGKYKRYLNPEIIKLYGHLNSADAIELDPETFDSYQTSNYVKYVNDERVYAVWPDGTKHWLNITPQQWDASGRDWNAIFTINELEVNHYKTGEEIVR